MTCFTIDHKHSYPTGNWPKHMHNYVFDQVDKEDKGQADEHGE